MALKKSKLSKNLEAFYFELRKGIFESDSEISSLKYKYDECWKVRRELTEKIFNLAKKIKRYKNMSFWQRVLFLFFPKGV